jgi:ankyrin repeat protein
MEKQKEKARAARATFTNWKLIGHYKRAILQRNLGTALALAQRGKMIPRLLPVMRAVEYEYEELTALLCVSGFNVNESDPRNGATPLHEAVQRKNYEIIKSLMRAGCDPTRRDDQGINPVMRLTKECYPFTAEKDGMILDEIFGNIVTTRGGQQEKKFLLRARYGPGDTLLHLAVRNQNMKTTTWCKRLLQEGADLNAQSYFGRTALMMATWHRNDEFVLELMLIMKSSQQDFKIYLQDSFGDNILHHVVRWGLIKSCEWLVCEQRMRITTKNHEKQAAIHIAARNGKLETARLLVQAGANLRLQARDKCKGLKVKSLRPYEIALKMRRLRVGTNMIEWETGETWEAGKRQILPELAMKSLQALTKVVIKGTMIGVSEGVALQSQDFAALPLPTKLQEYLQSHQN